ncbi:MAG: septal ring lytic transglycosylase RlpA, partial [Sphingomonadales bacterium]
MRALPLAAALLLGGCASAPTDVVTAPAPPTEAAKPPVAL